MRTANLVLAIVMLLMAVMCALGTWASITLGQPVNAVACSTGLMNCIMLTCRALNRVFA